MARVYEVEFLKMGHLDVAGELVKKPRTIRLIVTANTRRSAQHFAFLELRRTRPRDYREFMTRFVSFLRTI